MKTQYPLVLNALHEMQGSLLYAARKDVLASAEQIITHLEGLLNEVIEDRNNQRIRAEAAEAALKEAQEQEPVAYYKIQSDGSLQGPLMDNDRRMCKLRKREWTPLYARPVPANLVESHQIKRDSNSLEFEGIKTAPAVAAGLPAIGPYRDFIPAPAVPALAVPEEWREVMAKLISIVEASTKFHGCDDVTKQARALLQSSPKPATTGEDK